MVAATMVEQPTSRGLPGYQAERGKAKKSAGKEFSHGVLVPVVSPGRTAPAILLMAGARPFSVRTLTDDVEAGGKKRPKQLMAASTGQAP
jgi:hypothetical protein